MTSFVSVVTVLRPAPLPGLGRGIHCGVNDVIENAELAAIKVGVTRDLRQRLSTLRVASPSDLTLLLAIPGEPVTEARLHHAFLSEHISGEWFSGVGRLRGLVTWLCSLEEGAAAEAIAGDFEALEGIAWGEPKIDPETLLRNLKAVLVEEYGARGLEIIERAAARPRKPHAELPRSLSLLHTDSERR